MWVNQRVPTEEHVTAKGMSFSENLCQWELEIQHVWTDLCRSQKNLQFRATLWLKQTSDQEFAWFKPTVINCNCKPWEFCYKPTKLYTLLASLSIWSAYVQIFVRKNRLMFINCWRVIPELMTWKKNENRFPCIEAKISAQLNSELPITF